MDFPKYDGKGSPYEKSMTELTHVQQTRMLAEFNVKFDTISVRLDLPKAYIVEAYVSALKEEIANSLQLFNPRTMLEARRMVRVQEVALLWQSKKKMVFPIKNEPQEKSPETQGSVAGKGSASSFSSNTEVGYVDIMSGVNGSLRLDAREGVQERNGHRGSDRERLQEPFGQDPSFCSKQRLYPSNSLKSEAGCAKNSVENSGKVHLISVSSPLGSISSSPFVTPGCGMFSLPFMGLSLESIAVAFPSLPLSLQVEQQQSSIAKE